MKKRIVLTSLLLLTLTTVFCTEVTTGLTYDSHQESFPVGADFGIKETFEDQSSLSVSLAYKNAGAYTASIMYNKYISMFLLSGGLNYDISVAGITPGIAFGAGFVYKSFALTGAFTSNINPENIFKPYYYTTSADVIFDTPESIIDLSFLYTSKKTDAGKAEKIGGGLVFTARQEGAPATIDVITDVLYVTDAVNDITGIIADTGLGVNVILPFMTIKLKTLIDVMNPELPKGANKPFSIGLSTGFVL